MMIAPMVLSTGAFAVWPDNVTKEPENAVVSLVNADLQVNSEFGGDVLQSASLAAIAVTRGVTNFTTATLSGEAQITQGCVNRGENVPLGPLEETVTSVSVSETNEYTVTGDQQFLFELTNDEITGPTEGFSCSSQNMTPVIVSVLFTDITLTIVFNIGNEPPGTLYATITATFSDQVINVITPAAATCNGVSATHPGTRGNDNIVGTEGPDVIAGLGGNDVIQGLGGNDFICGDEGNDEMVGDTGDDIMYGGYGVDGMGGGAGIDNMRGDVGDDIMYGNDGNDIMSGGPGVDGLGGDAGDDYMDGGDGSDDYGDGGAGIDQCINIETPPINCEGASLIQQPLLGNATTLGNVQGTSGGDTIPPTITVPNNMEVETADPSGGGGAVALYEVTATDDVDGTATLEEDGITITQDNVNGSITIACNPPSGSQFPIGDTLIDCTATDAAGNSAAASFTITVTVPASTTTGPTTLQAEEPATTDGEQGQQQEEDDDTAAGMDGEGAEGGGGGGQPATGDEPAAGTGDTTTGGGIDDGSGATDDAEPQ